MTPYQQGRAAYDQEMTYEANPYPMKNDSDARRRWFDGWNDADLASRFGFTTAELGVEI